MLPAATEEVQDAVFITAWSLASPAPHQITVNVRKIYTSGFSSPPSSTTPPRRFPLGLFLLPASHPNWCRREWCFSFSRSVWPAVSADPVLPRSLADRHENIVRSKLSGNSPKVILKVKHPVKALLIRQTSALTYTLRRRTKAKWQFTDIN